ncbi:DUF5053 domain-containing protein [Duncaniella sp.]|uniref:DUF5053 domain-containing protein n=1 Tax=Duncaniella sp. TaxID=2518496 RepID=UPI0023BF98AC|nr:DUF5053 domain-containing protein [Duncaniella sp.]MDE5904057.1 DUF5053 domain-containing protein [Duncaniella sp.]
MQNELKSLLDAIAKQTDLSAEATDLLMSQAFAMTKTPEERREAGAYLTEAISKRKRPDVDVREMLGDVAEALNLSYIAKRYFNKDRTWLYQRLNHAMVNGKPASFTESELKRLSDSLDELSNKIHQISIQLTH